MYIIQGVNYVPGRSNISTTSNIKKKTLKHVKRFFKKSTFCGGWRPPTSKGTGGARGGSKILNGNIGRVGAHLKGNFETNPKHYS